MANAPCVFCDRQIDPADLVTAWPHWQVIVNRNQNYLGKLMLVLKRHETDVTALSAAEQEEFWQLLAAVHRALAALFQPDHFNDVFLMNQDRHVHLHVIPRYAAPREFAGIVFTDGQLGKHYQFGENFVDVSVRRALSEALRRHLR